MVNSQFIVMEVSGKVLGHLRILDLVEIDIKVGLFKNGQGQIVSLAFEDNCELAKIADRLLTEAGIHENYRLMFLKREN